MSNEHTSAENDPTPDPVSADVADEAGGASSDGAPGEGDGSDGIAEGADSADGAGAGSADGAGSAVRAGSGDGAGLADAGEAGVSARVDAAGDTGATASAQGDPPQYGVGPFSIREVSLAGVWLLAFVVSFFPIYGAVAAGAAVWNNGIDWVLTIGAPTVAVFLLVLRRLSPQGIRRVGSLGVDQFASVSFSVATIVWLGILWGSFLSLAKAGIFLATWVVWAEFVLMAAGVVLTVVAPILPVLGEDFRFRPESVAHRSARRIRPVVARPAAARAPEATVAAGGPVEAAGTMVGTRTAVDSTSVTGSTTAVDSTTVLDVTSALDTTSAQHETGAGDAAEDAETVVSPTAAAADDGSAAAVVDDAVSGAQRASASQAFWALVPVERDVVDAEGAPLFRIGPTAWALVIEDRGATYIVRDDDGRTGYLHDVSGVTRG